VKHVLSLTTLYPNPVNPRFGTFVARSLEALAKRGDWRVTVVNPIGLPPLALGRYRPLADLPATSAQGGITIQRPHFTLIPGIGARRNAAAIARAALPLVQRIHAETPIDLIDAQLFFPDGPAAAIIAHTLGLPLSIKARGSDISVWGEHGFARQQMLEAASAASGLLAVSHDLAGRMAAMGMDAARITVHYTGLDRDRFRPLDHTQLRSQLSREFGFALPDNAPLIACVGALTGRKGQGMAIAALKDIPGARLILVGGGEDEARLRALAASEGATDRVFFAGPVDHDMMPLILSAADVMVLPTEAEGLANVWVEALACGTPVVTSDIGGARELITCDTAGRLAERNPQAVAAAVNAILNAPPARAAVAALVEEFSWDANAAALAAHYKEVVGQ
jgi:glycosyltransferase involved in cell wall biosynthesis